MQAVIFNSLIEAEAFVEHMNSALGYPKPETGTLNYTYPAKHSDSDRWMCVVEEDGIPFLREGDVLEGTNSTWFGDASKLIQDISIYATEIDVDGSGVTRKDDQGIQDRRDGSAPSGVRSPLPRGSGLSRIG